MNFLKNKTILGLICILLSLIICFGVTPLFNEAVGAKTEIIRVSKNIKAGEVITNSKVQTVTIGGYNLPDNVLKDKSNIVGKYATADLMKGDYILSSKVSDDPLTENEYLYNFDGSKRAISVTIKSFAAGLSGKIEKGDIVSIIASDYGEFRETIIFPELQYVEVLAVTTKKGTDRIYEGSSSEEDQELPSTITLIVNERQSKLLAELEQNSKIHTALVYRGKRENAERFLKEQEELILKLEGNISNPEVTTSNDDGLTEAKQGVTANDQ
ncbi:Flp pilus assembly protein CpaB [Maledivibacter halophilus]|uniref:Pilus assembly protein CpaB n=1 Tax=Maledivibacter halophilus TaxID=36842 RepID=A0A1T5LVH9_9FIRM|nr:Flp pilus assembly protein CpaB [Maledivibacter halophilus]SKC79996.1 pilus assembly protein CpaB [Maledivibacter halophilus]